MFIHCMCTKLVLYSTTVSVLVLCTVQYYSKCTCAVTIDDTPKEEEEEETLLNKCMRISLCVSDDAIAKLYVM